MNTQQCPTCKKLGFDVYMFGGVYYTDCCQTTLESDFDEKENQYD